MSIKTCCQQPEHLTVRAERVYPSGDVEVERVCLVCGCRHFEVSAKPIVINVAGK